MANSKMSSTNDKGDKHFPDYDERFLSDDENEIRIVLVGRTGSGISSSGNSILQQEHFRSGTSGSSVTKCCEVGTTKRHGRTVKVVDSPGLFGNCLTKDEIKREIMNCFRLTLPGPHAILYILRIGRFTNEEVSGVKCFLEIFGNSPLHFTIIIFTCVDDLEWNKSSVEEFIDNAPISLKKLVQDCSGRYVFLNNRLSNSVDSVYQLNKLFKTVEDMMRDNENKCPYYTNQILKQLKIVSPFSKDHEHGIRYPLLKVILSILFSTGILTYMPKLYPLAIAGFGYACVTHLRKFKKKEDTLSKVIDEIKDDISLQCNIS